MSEDSARHVRHLREPVGHWPKVFAFVIGMAAAFGLYFFVAARFASPFATWRSSAITRLGHPASSAKAVAGSVSVSDFPDDMTAKSSASVGDPDDAPIAELQVTGTETHSASERTRRHRHKHRAAARR